MAFKSSLTSTPPSPQAPEGFSLDKWRLASQIQKAVRHGKVLEGLWAVEQLWALDAAYLRYRLSVIAVEDVGAAQAATLVPAFSNGWGKKQVDAQGGLDFLLPLVQGMIEGVKDRLPCNWMGCTRWKSEFEQRHGSFETLPVARAIELAMDRDLSWWERGLAAWRAAGTDKFSNAFLPKVAGDWETWKQQCALRVNDPLIAAMMSVGEHQREAHPVFLGLAMVESRLAVAQVETPRIPDLPNIGPWLSATFDKHTADGKRAYKRWLSTHPQALNWLRGQGIDDEAALDAVGRLAFWVEGGQCDRQIAHDLSRQVVIDTKRRYLERNQLSPQPLAQLCVDPPGWHEARAWAVLGHKPVSRPGASLRS